MFQSLIRSFGLQENAQRVKAELEAEIAEQQSIFRSRLSSIAGMALWAAVLFAAGAVSWLLLNILVYKWVSKMADPLWGIGMLLVVHLAIALAGLLQLRSSQSHMPVTKAISLPTLYKAPVAPLTSATRGQFAEDGLYSASTGQSANSGAVPIRDWIHTTMTNSIFGEAAKTPAVAHFFNAASPKIEAATGDVIREAEAMVRDGDRKALWGTLFAAAAVGTLISRRRNNVG